MKLPMRFFCSILLCNFNSAFLPTEDSAVRPLNVNNTSAIVEKVLAGYQYEVGPLENGKPVSVKVQVHINDMMAVAEADMHLSTDFYLRMEWTDTRLRFPAENKDVFIPFSGKFSHQIWTPSLYFPNGKGGERHELTKENIFVKVHSDGRIYYSERLSLLSFCQMNMTYYPFDIQRCNLTMEDYSNPIEYMRLIWHNKPWKTSVVELNSQEFDRILIDEWNETRIGDFGHKFDKLVIQFTLYRDIYVILLRDFLPCILIVMISWIAFWISHTSIPSRVNLGITTVLTTVSMTIGVQKVNPQSSTLRSLDVFLLICLLFVFGALLELALTGVADPRGGKWWQKSKEKVGEPESEENQTSEDSTANGKKTKRRMLAGFENTEFSSSCNFPCAPLIKSSISSRSERCDDVGGKRKGTLVTCDGKYLRFFGPFAFFQREPHIVDQYAKVIFPSLYGTFLLFFFLFHYFHKDTVGGSNSP